MNSKQVIRLWLSRLFVIHFGTNRFLIFR